MATDVEVKIFIMDEQIAEACQLSDGSWEIHGMPLETSPWGYWDTIEEFIANWKAPRKPTEA